MREFNNDASWKNAFDSMFGAIRMRDCTPETILETIDTMPRSSNRCEDITIAARERNIACNDETVLECLRTLYKDGEIQHRCIVERHFFIRGAK